MKRILASLLVFSFVLWIMPLEKVACDGQRAMCMCHALVPHATAQNFDSTGALKSASATNNASSGGSNYFVSTRPTLTLNVQLSTFFDDQHLTYISPYLTALEYVPKV